MNAVSSLNPWGEPIILPTERPGLTLEQIVSDDAPYFFDSWRYSVADIARFDPNAGSNFDSIEEVEALPYQPGSLTMGAWDNGRFVGSGTLSTDKEVGVWTLGYWTDSREINKGYGSIIAQTLVSYAADRIPVIRATAMEENIPSVRILEKSGLERTGRKVGDLLVFELIT